MKEQLYSGNAFLSNATTSDLTIALGSESDFNELFHFITVEYFDGIKMDCDAVKWAESGHVIMSTCKDLKIEAKFKKK